MTAQGHDGIIEEKENRLISEFSNMSRRTAYFAGLTKGATAACLVFHFIKSSIPRVLNEEGVEPPKYPWSHSGLFSSYDHARYCSLFLL